MSFKDAMSKVANTVSILAFDEGKESEEIFAVTISSLMSVSVSENEEEILFVLKNNSHAAMKLMVGTRFTINVLSDLQSDLAQTYGGTRHLKEFRSQLTKDCWDIVGDVPMLKNAHLVFTAEINHIVQRKYSNLYLGHISNFIVSSDTQPLIHYLRMYQAPNPKFI
jgi:flavin reductase (DIM6/NTAB) family NADH-FMN oxidoreductase RutF